MDFFIGSLLAVGLFAGAIEDNHWWGYVLMFCSSWCGVGYMIAVLLRDLQKDKYEGNSK